MLFYLKRFILLYCFFIGSLQAIWSPPVNISSPLTNDILPNIAIDPAGNATAVWILVQSDGFSSQNLIQAAIKPVNQDWQPPVNVAFVGSSAFTPLVVVDVHGHATALWLVEMGMNTVLQSSTKYMGQDYWQLPIVISALNQNAFEPQLTVDLAGNVTAIWKQVGSSPTDANIQVATKLFGQAWGVSLTLSTTDVVPSNPQITSDAAGNLTAVWSTFHADNSSTIQAIIKLVGGNWQTPIDISAHLFRTLNPQVSANPVGYATAVWSFTTSLGSGGTIQAATLLPGQNWQPPVTLFTGSPGESNVNPLLVVDPAGNATILWTRPFMMGIASLLSATKLFGQDWQSPEVVFANMNASAINPQLAVDPQGNVTAIWNQVDMLGMQSLILASTKPFLQSWPLPDILSPLNVPSSNPHVAAASLDHIIAVWSLFNGVTNIIQSAEKQFNLLVTDVHPNMGRERGGNVVRITGKGFSHDVIAVNFGQQSSLGFTVLSDTLIRAIAPPGTGTVDVTVMTHKETSLIIPSDQYTYLPPQPPSELTITSINPNSGPAKGDNSVTITGIGFNDVIDINFGDESALSFIIQSDNLITAVVPPGTGTIEVIVVSHRGTSIPTSSSFYTYLSPQPPTHLKGVQQANRFATQTDLINILTWNPPVDGTTPVSYAIYRDAQLTDLVVVMDAQRKLKFEDHNRRNKHTYTYFIVTLDQFNQMSAPASIVVHSK